MELTGIFLDPTVPSRLTILIPLVLTPDEPAALSRAIKSYIREELGKTLFLIDGVVPSPSTGGKLTQEELRGLVYAGKPLLLTFVATEPECKDIYYRSRTSGELMSELNKIEYRVNALSNSHFSQHPPDVDVILCDDYDSLSRIEKELANRMELPTHHASQTANQSLKTTPD